LDFAGAQEREERTRVLDFIDESGIQRLPLLLSLLLAILSVLILLKKKKKIRESQGEGESDEAGCILHAHNQRY
jgi:hypothetical protein